MKPDRRCVLSWGRAFKKSSNQNVAIVVTGMGLAEILSIPSIPAGTGLAMGGAILKVLEE